MLVAAVAVMVVDRCPVVLVMGAAVAVLLLADVIDEATALSGFASSAPLTIAALYVVAGAAGATGALGGVVDSVLGRGAQRAAPADRLDGGDVGVRSQHATRRPDRAAGDTLGTANRELGRRGS